ncbi:unnamed protein product [Phytophthora lilii]|uniref:Unnamed protein product n=1 Tax=Phytophthora lilii TaxID=2077276 RepID=A0A9W6UAC1_9STRA|nr:unnamed protein product [Phytophthora lilii]
MLVEIVTEKRQAQRLEFPLHVPTQRLSSPLAVGLHGGGIMMTARNQLYQTKYSTLFPDEEHSCEPKRHVRFAALSRNALPYTEQFPRHRRPRGSPPKRAAIPPPSKGQTHNNRVPSSYAVQALRKSRRNKTASKVLEEGPSKTSSIHRVAYDDDPDSQKLWGFSVRYSPKKQLETQWRATEGQHFRVQHVKDEQEIGKQKLATRSQQQAMLDDADYAQYLYLASLYGPLDALLFCCCPPGSQGRIYKLLVETSARRIQRWGPLRITALRRYWVGHLARKMATTSILQGVDSVINSLQQNDQAIVLFNQFQFLRVAKVLASWRKYAVRMAQLRDKMRLALAKDLERRFYQWRDNVKARKRFKQQLKRVARRKALQFAFKQWQLWQKQQEKLRCHLVQRWLQTKRECWKMWSGFVLHNCSANVLQRSWRHYTWQIQRKHSAIVITKIFRGWKSRQKVKILRENIAIHSVLLRVVGVATWKVQCETLTLHRRQLVERELTQARKCVEYIVNSENEAAAQVEAELAKVVRNNMHRNLEENIQILKMETNAMPLQTAKSNSSFARMATQRLITSERAQARNEIVKLFRVQGAMANSNPCLICQVHDDFSRSECLHGCISHHVCISPFCKSIDGSSDVYAQLQVWETSAGVELARLDQIAQERTQGLLSIEPPIQLIWKSITTAQNGSHVKGYPNSRDLGLRK